MNTILNSYQIEAIRKADSLIVDLSDTIVKGNVLYGAFYLVKERAKKGKFLDALKLAANGIRIFAVNHLKRFSDEWGSGNHTIEDVYECCDKYGIKRKEVEKASRKYIESRLSQIPGVKSCLRTLKNFGEKKETTLITREPPECAEVAMDYFGLDECISNKSRLNKDGTINGIQIVMKKPEDKLRLLQEKLKEHGLELGNAIMITDNPEDSDLFKGKVGVFVTYRNKRGEININNYREFERQLINSD